MTYRVFGLGLAAALAMSGVAAAAPAAKPKPSPAPAPPPFHTKNMTIVTDTTDGNLQTGDFTMPHHVKFTRPGTSVVGDSAHGNSHQETVTIEGHVVMNDDGNAPEGEEAGARGGGPSTLTCDKLEIDSKRRIYIATGNVHFAQGDRHGTSDYGKLDQSAHTLDLSGNVFLSSADETLSGQNVHYNTQTKDVHVDGTPIQMTQPVNGPAPTPAPVPKKKP